MVSTTANPDSELFCSVSSTQKVPERHPSTLIPGGHASPLRHPTVLRPGAGNHHARKSSSETPNTPAQHHQRTPSTTPKPAYKAYSPPATPQDPRASVVAEEIEGFFTALDIQPLNIKKQDTISSPSSASSGRVSPDIQRCASPPLPPKVKLEEPQRLSPPAEVSPSSESETKEQEEESDSDAPPAYNESERVQPPPEKPAATVTSETQESEEEPTNSTPTLAGSAAMSAAKVGGSVAGVDTDEAVAKDTTEKAKPDTQTNSEESTTEQQPQQPTEETSTTEESAAPPPLPPRPTASTTPQPDTPAQMPGAFPPPPRRTPSPKGHSSSSSYSKMTYVPGAAATSATAVGAAVAIPSTDFAHGGLAHARKALGQRVSHLIDKAKEHHEARKGAAASRGVEEGKDKNVLVVAPMIGA